MTKSEITRQAKVQRKRRKMGLCILCGMPGMRVVYYGNGNILVKEKRLNRCGTHWKGLSKP